MKSRKEHGNTHEASSPRNVKWILLVFRNIAAVDQISV